MGSEGAAGRFASVWVFFFPDSALVLDGRLVSSVLILVRLLLGRFRGLV